MKLPCEIVEDLLPLYEDGVCSKESREAVEEHLRECGECRAKVENIALFPLPENQEGQREADQAMVRTFRKLKHRWWQSLIAVALGAVLVMLSVNQARGSGLCFTNVDEILTVGKYIRALEKGNFEETAGYMVDYARMYQDIQEALASEPEEFAADFVSVMIGESEWMASDSFYRQYLRDEEDPDQIWGSLIYNHAPGIMVPEEIWDTITAWEPEIVENLASGEILLDDQPYTRIATEWGNYVVAADNLHDSPDSAADYCYIMNLVPAGLYQSAEAALKKDAQETYQNTQEFYGAVADMDLEEFTEYVRADYVRRWQECLKKGYSLESTGYKASYRVDDQWQVEYGLRVSYEEEQYQMNAGFIVSQGKLTLVYTSSREDNKRLDEIREILSVHYHG